MKKFMYSMRNYGVVIAVLVVVVIAGAVFINSNKPAYSKNNTGEISDDAASLEPTDGEIDEKVFYTPETNKVLKETYYTLDEVYESIEMRLEEEIGTVEPELNEIYQNFYDYFGYENNFKNMYGEEYNYDEYMFVINYSKVKVNENLFGLYLIRNSKCDVFSSVSNHSRDNMLKSYCVIEE